MIEAEGFVEEWTSAPFKKFIRRSKKRKKSLF